jgi:hypothetical protein
MGPGLLDLGEYRTNAVENEPSANSRRMKLGMRNATQKASVPALAPRSR